MEIMKPLFLITFLFFFCLCACQNGQRENDKVEKNDSVIMTSEQKQIETSSLYKIDLGNVVRKAKVNPIKMSDMIQSIEYVPLQTTDESLINPGRRFSVSLVTDKIIVADIKLFERQSGRYLGDLLRQGQGPEEYLSLTDIAGDDEREELYLLDNAKGVVYVVGYDGHYKGFVGGIGDYSELSCLGNGNLLIAGNIEPLNNNRVCFYIINVDSKQTLYKHVSPVLRNVADVEDASERIGPYKQVNGSIVNKYWTYQGDLFYYDTLNDSIYRVDENYEIHPVGYMDTETLRMTSEQSRIGIMSRNFEVYQIQSIHETLSGIYIYLMGFNTVQKTMIDYWVTYSKKDGVTFASKSGENKSLSIINDVDQGISFSLTRGDYAFLSPESMQEHIKKKGSSYFNTASGKRFKSIGDSLLFDDNPVMAILKCK